MNFFWSPSPTKRSTKNPRKIRGKFGAKFGAKIRKIRETFVLQLLWPKKKSAEIGHGLSTPLWLHWHAMKHVYWELSCPSWREDLLNSDNSWRRPNRYRNKNLPFWYPSVLTPHCVLLRKIRETFVLQLSLPGYSWLFFQDSGPQGKSVAHHSRKSPQPRGFAAAATTGH